MASHPYKLPSRPFPKPQAPLQVPPPPLAPQATGANAVPLGTARQERRARRKAMEKAEAEATKTAKLVRRSEAKINQLVLAREVPPPPPPPPQLPQPPQPPPRMSRVEYFRAVQEAKRAIEHYVQTLPMNFDNVEK
ncbi:hypothetical protein DFQ26_000285 [Actinomortierella ambigua]|nr:hypothetical protein DFQ26_000285 [Actinomortierella ambigua]